MNRAGGYSCQCKKGFVGNGWKCSDVDECSAAKSPCHERAKCFNEPGTYRCKDRQFKNYIHRLNSVNLESICRSVENRIFELLKSVRKASAAMERHSVSTWTSAVPECTSATPSRIAVTLSEHSSASATEVSKTSASVSRETVRISTSALQAITSVLAKI